MSLLVVGTNLDSPSQLWMRRQIELLGNAVVAIATNPPVSQRYRDRYHIIELAEESPRFYQRQITRVTGGLVRFAPRDTPTKLVDATTKLKPTGVLIHYLNRAVDFCRPMIATGIPTWVYCHGFDVTWDMRSPMAPNVKQHPDDYVERVQRLPQTVRFIANSNATKAKLLSIGINPSRIDVMYFGVVVPPRPHRKPAQRLEVMTLYLGRLVDFKGPDLTIKAFERACDAGMKGRLVMAGDGPLRVTCELLRARSKYRDHIEILGAVDSDTAQRLRDEADIFTAHNCTGPLTGQEEAFGVSLIEAMASALPVVSGDSGSLSEVLGAAGAATLFQPGDIDAHAKTLLRLANDKQRRIAIGLSSWQRARQFTAESELDALRRILPI